MTSAIHGLGLVEGKDSTGSPQETSLLSYYMNTTLSPPGTPPSSPIKSIGNDTTANDKNRSAVKTTNLKLDSLNSSKTPPLLKRPSSPLSSLKGNIC